MTPDINATISVTALVVSIGMFFLALYKLRGQSKKAEVEELRAEVRDLREHVEILEEKLQDCERGRAALLDENIALMRKIIKSI